MSCRLWKSVNFQTELFSSYCIFQEYHCPLENRRFSSPPGIDLLKTRQDVSVYNNPSPLFCLPCQICALILKARLSFWALLERKFYSHFIHKKLYPTNRPITRLLELLRAAKNCVPKMDFSLYFQKVIWVGGKHFLPKKNSEKAKHPGICPSFSGNVPKTYFCHCPIIPPYLYVILMCWSNITV